MNGLTSYDDFGQVQRQHLLSAEEAIDLLDRPGDRIPIARMVETSSIRQSSPNGPWEFRGSSVQEKKREYEVEQGIAWVEQVCLEQIGIG